MARQTSAHGVGPTPAYGAGRTSLELVGHMHRGILDHDAHFAQVTGQLAADLGLTG
ncbi:MULTISPECIES: hypothetical protein [unclassified Nocardioides]|uniref:hypothetical protein n=1 Tax=unclassified Nocardioides TaxID=2615069 RepID=UPI0009F15B29|nr:MULTISPECIES: hypothetical protein [unclassified Nocardioides]GAW51485.1 Transcriptional regulator, TetR family [Nocardioides sp. PD653-B2]GAW54081.1 Transcriptional regulator, TetR family [Nocardioides sp. PD653]